MSARRLGPPPLLSPAPEIARYLEKLSLPVKRVVNHGDKPGGRLTIECTAECSARNSDSLSRKALPSLEGEIASNIHQWQGLCQACAPREDLQITQSILISPLSADPIKGNTGECPTALETGWERMAMLPATS